MELATPKLRSGSYSPEWPLDAGPYTFVWVDALTQKVREGGGIVNVHVLVATAVNADGRREILGCEVTSGEDGAGWLAFLRGLAGVQLVVSDAHRDRVDAIAYVGAQNGGRLIEAGDEAESLAVRFEEIGALAESRDASRDLIVRIMRMYE